MTAPLHDHPANRLLLHLSRVLWLTLCGCLWAAAPFAQAGTTPPCQAPCQIDLAGTWRFLPGNLVGAPQFDPAQRRPDAQWRDIRVPANWHLEGIDHSGVAWYRKEFEAPAAAPATRALLQFGGIDYFADVWLNGRYLGAHEGYFEAFAFDVTHALRPGQRNELLVRVDSPVEHPSAWSLRKRLIKGIFSHHDTRPGGAWSTRGQEQNTGGIWSEVTLRFGQPLVLDEPQVRSRVDTAAGTVAATVTLGTWSDTRRPTPPAELELTFTPHNFTGRSYRERRAWPVAAGHTHQSIDIALPAAELWWPAELGQPHLYRVQATLRSGGRVLDQRETVTGLREVRVDPRTQQWHVNGQRLFLRGTNYIATQWLAEMDSGAYRRDIALMRAAHVNAVRVHAHVGDRRWYRACDEAGLLVWQDFPLQWGYTDSPEFQTEAQRQVAAMVRTLDSHPSIIAWSLHNEPPWDAWWMKYKYPDYDPHQNRVLDDDLERTVRHLDSSRYVHKASTSGEHQWQGWYSGHWTDFNKPTTHALVTEFGAQALPGIASLRRLFNEDNLFPDTDKKLEAWQYHNFQPDETFKNAKISKGKNIHAFIANSQTYQARLIQLAAESLRRQKYHPVGAIFQFMFVEDWPSMNWGVVDYWRVPKAGYDALARAYQPLLPSIEWDQEQPAAGSVATFTLWLVNDTLQSHTALAYAWRLACNGKTLAEDQFTAAVEADAATRLRRIESPALPPGSCTLRATVTSAQGTPLADNQHDFNVL
ncbi:MAG: hypothetical protein RL260_1868 [Pseudomonadota bacterium]